jgi:hypothetical protein
MNIDCGKFTQIIETNSGSRIDQAACRRDYKHPWRSAHGPRKRSRVGNLPSKIEATEKRENLRDWRSSFSAQRTGERKLCLLTQDHSRSFPSGVSGREQENAANVCLFHCNLMVRG